MTNQDYRPPLGTAVDEAHITEDQRAVIEGLESWLVFLKTTAGFPVDRYSRIDYQVSAKSVEDVDAVAEILGVTPEWNGSRSHYTAERRFGPVRYHAVYIGPEYMARLRAHSSYSNCVEPDGCRD